MIFAVVALSGLNIFQFFYWAWQNQMLVNKIMCKDLVEYKHALKPEIQQKDKSEEEFLETVEEESILAELNGHLAGR